MTHIAFIGFGEAAQAMARGLADEPRVDRLTAFDIRLSAPEQAEPLRRAAEETGTELTADMSQALRGADVVLSLVVGSTAVKVAGGAAAMEIEAVGERIGQACAVKMIRSIIVKGIEALLLQSLTAAECRGFASASWTRSRRPSRASTGGRPRPHDACSGL